MNLCKIIGQATYASQIHVIDALAKAALVTCFKVASVHSSCGRRQQEEDSTDQSSLPQHVTTVNRKPPAD